MIIKEISKDEYLEFVLKSEYSSMYQSIEWQNFKEHEHKKCELLGLFKGSSLVGVSLVVYSRVLKKFQMAYASRGFIYDYKNIEEFKSAIINYFKDKKVIFFRMDPPIILASYNPKMEKSFNENSMNIINKLKDNGFIHYGFNTAYETMQFRFIHRIDTYKPIEMNKSTRKNIEKSLFKGVKIRKVDNNSLDEVLEFFNMTSNRKNFEGLSKNFYLNLIESFKDDVSLYITYIDKNVYIDNLKNELNNLDKQYEELITLKKHDNVGSKLKNKESIILNSKKKYQDELSFTNTLNEITDIAAILSITKYNEVIAFASGMDNNYRNFNPKYVMYPELIKDAITKKKKYVNFLGVKNIFDKNDKDYGIYEVKRGFGGETIEYIGEFDLPINAFVYKLYKLISK